MLLYIVRRVIMLIPILFLISVVSFIVIELPPGDFTKLGVKAGDTITLDHAKLKSYLR